MGAGTWTGELYNRLQSSPGDAEGGAPALTVRAHGPYGAQPFGLPAEEDAVLFYVGGIGVTPAASCADTASPLGHHLPPGVSHSQQR